jgi:Protein of unknown function (DUF2975)
MNDSTTTRARFTAAAVFRALAVIGMIAAVGFIAATTWDAITGDTIPEPVPVTLDGADYSGALPDGVRIDTLDARLTAEVGPGWRITWGLVSVVPAMLVIAALWIMFRLLDDRHDPFTMTNVGRLRRLAWIATGFLAVDAARGPIEAELQHSIGLEVIDVEFAFGVPLVIAMLAWAFSEVWRRGVELRTEQALTI